MNRETTDEADARWRHVDTLFSEALDRAPDERVAFLSTACQGDADLRREVEALLDAHAAAVHFLDEPADWFEVPPLPGPDGVEGERKAAALPEQQRIGPYRLLDKLGEGGMGTVWRAERADGQFEQRVALKLVRAGLSSDDTRRRFRQERQILARLSHPHIARLLDGGVLPAPGGEEQPYLVMELVDGEPLTAYADRRRLSVEARLALFAQVCEAARYAHGNLVIHRDLKPSNILVAEEGPDGQPSAKLLDFGIARLLEDEDDAGAATQTAFPRLTPEYAAPEQVRGEPVTTATDVYSLGVVLYELLTGHRPYHFARYTPAEIERVVGEWEPERPSTVVTRTTETRTPQAVSRARGVEPEALRRRLRGDLDAVVLKALRKEPSARYATVDAFLEDMHRHRAGQPVAAHPATAGYRLRLFVRRHRWGVAAAAVFALLLLGGTVVTAVQSRQIRDQAEALVAERDRAQDEADKATRVTDFLLTLARGDTLTAGALMARGLREADALGHQPEVQAQMLEVIGRTYRSTGRPDLARPPLERALALRRRLHPAPHPDLARSLYWVAAVSSDLGDYGRAEPLFGQALAMQRGLLEAADPDLGATLFGLGGVLHFRGRQAEADTLFQEALGIFRRLPDAADPEAMDHLMRMAQYLSIIGSYADAGVLYGRALEMQRAYYGEGHPVPAETQMRLAMTLVGEHRYREGEQMLREGLGVAVAQLGEHPPLIQEGRIDLAHALYLQGRYDEAEPLLRQVLDARPYQSASLRALALLRLGVVLRDQGRFEEAERAFRENIRLREETLGEGNVYVGEALISLGRLERLRGNYDAATAHLTRSRTILASRLRADHPWQARVMLELAFVRAETGAFAEAEPLLRQTLAIQGQSPHVLPYNHAEALRLMGVTLTRLGRYEAAEPFLRASLRLAEERERPDLAAPARQALGDLDAARRRAPR